VLLVNRRYLEIVLFNAGIVVNKFTRTVFTVSNLSCILRI
jgi:hypothetical protein